MPKVKAPFVGAKADSSDLTGSAKSMIMGVGGIALLTVVMAYGQQVGSRVLGFTDSMFGTNAGDSGGILIDGDI